MSEKVTLQVPSQPKYLYIIRSTVYPVVHEAGFSKRETRRIVLALDEACSNIIKYAYHGDPTKAIVMGISVDPMRITIQLKDSGAKPDVDSISPRALDDIRPGGLGTHIMKSVFDRVEYDTSAAEGTVLTLVKNKPPS